MEELEKVNVIREAMKSGASGLLASVLPIAGPAALGFMSGATLARWQNRCVEDIASIEDRLSLLEGRVHRGYVRSDEFADLFADAMSAAARFEDEQRRCLYSSVVVAAAIEGPGSQVVARRMIRRIEDLDPIHFQFLKAIAEGRDTVRGPAPTNSASEHMALLLSAVSGQDESTDHSRQLLEDLVREGHLEARFVDGLGTIRSSFSSRDAKRWVLRQGQETLQYLWPEEHLS